MKEITVKEALKAIAINVMRRTYFVVSRTLYKMFRFEFEAERKWRVRRMQKLLDAEHQERLGWVGSCRGGISL